MGFNVNVTEASADPLSISKEITEYYAGKEFIYNPARERQVSFYSSSTPRTDIKEGEELLENYLGMTSE